MTPHKLDVLIAIFCYAGNGGVATILPEIGLWLGKRMKEWDKDDRIGRVAVKRYGDIPLTMERNKVVKDAKDGGYDAILMLDSDNLPDLYDGHRAWAKPFWETSFDFLYERSKRCVPSVVCAPYCGPPPDPRTGGCENVYVFRTEDNETGNLEMGFRLEAYDRDTAAQMRGIQEIAAGPTGVILYSTSAFDLMPIGEYENDGAILDAYSKGELSQERAIRLINMQSWFFYEFTDSFQTQKASTEDVTNTREIQMAGYQQFGEPVVFCNWDAWAGHMKPKCVGMPEPIRMGQINSSYVEAVKKDIKIDEQIVDLEFNQDFDLGEQNEVPNMDYDTPTEEELPAEEHNHGAEVVPRMIFGRKVYSVGHITFNHELIALRDIVDDHAKAFPDRQIRVVEVGSWVGESAIALQAGLGPSGGHVFCVDTWEGTETDRLGAIAKDVGSERLFDYFKQNIGDLLGVSVTPIKGESLTVARDLERSDVDVIFLDAGHSEKELKEDMSAWWHHLAPDGVMCGHDHCEAFPGVVKAVDEFCKVGGVKPNIIEGTSIWTVSKSEVNENFSVLTGGENAEKEEAASKSV